VGYYVTDDFFFACPTAQRAVLAAADALRTVAGVEVVPLNVRPGLMKELACMYYAVMGADGGMSEFKGGLEGEPLHEMYQQLYFMANLPNVLRPLLRGFLTLTGEPRPASLLKVAHGKTVKQFWFWLAQRSVLKQEFLQELTSQGIQAVITPSFGVPALKHGLSAHLNVAAAYNFIYNLLDLPAGVQPVTRVRAGEDVYSAPHGQQDRYAKKAALNAVGSVGLPQGVQVVGMPFADETVLRVMAILEAALPTNTAEERVLGPIQGLD
jgi:fatty acid amide hydrolase